MALIAIAGVQGGTVRMLLRRAWRLLTGRCVLCGDRRWLGAEGFRISGWCRNCSKRWLHASNYGGR